MLSEKERIQTKHPEDPETMGGVSKGKKEVVKVTILIQDAKSHMGLNLG